MASNDMWACGTLERAKIQAAAWAPESGVNGVADDLMSTALLRAASMGSVSCVEALLAAGADPGAPDPDWQGGLDLASWRAERAEASLGRFGFSDAQSLAEKAALRPPSAALAGLKEVELRVAKRRAGNPERAAPNSARPRAPEPGGA